MAKPIDIQRASAWLRLTLTPGLGVTQTHLLLSEFGHPEDIFRASLTALSTHIDLRLARAVLGLDDASTTRELAVKCQLQALLTSQASLVPFELMFLDDVDYPASLLESPQAPALLWLQGNRSLLASPAIAIVGSRNATLGGESTASSFAQALANQGLCIVSGLASGIDAAAHRGALNTAGSTIAVLGNGIDQYYPKSNRALQQVIAQKGLLVSELPIGCASARHNFPRRNRLIAALGCATVVVEAAKQSGSLITARLALEIGRDVMAVPGSIHSAHSKGCHALIKQGAKLVECVEDIVLELPATIQERLEHRQQSSIHGDKGTGSSQNSADISDSDAGSQILRRMGFDPIDQDDLLADLKLPTGSLADLQAQLLGLELAGRIERLPDGRFQQLVSALQ